MARLERGTAERTGGIECAGGERNSWCSGDMIRCHEELRLGRQPTVALLTVRLDGEGIEQD